MDGPGSNLSATGQGPSRGASLAAGTQGAGLLSGRRIAHERSLRPSGWLPHIVRCDAAELRLTRACENCFLEVVLALTGGIGLHCSHKVLGVEPDQTWHSGPLADPALAVTARAGDRLAPCATLVGLD